MLQSRKRLLMFRGPDEKAMFLRQSCEWLGDDSVVLDKTPIET
jgi:hypothetical protein